MSYLASLFKLLLIFLIIMLHFYTINQWINYLAVLPAKKTVTIKQPIMINFISTNSPPPVILPNKQLDTTTAQVIPRKTTIRHEANVKKTTISTETKKVSSSPKPKKLTAPPVSQKIPVKQPTVQSATKPTPAVKKSIISKEKLPIPVATTQTTATKPSIAPLPEPVAQAVSSSAINGTSDSKAAIVPKSSTLSKNITLKSNDSASAVVKKSQPYTPPNHHASYLHNPKPLYPRISQQLEEQGTVQLLVNVNIHGQVSQVQIKHSCGYPRLDMAALQAVQQWKFIPAKQGDIPIAATTIVPIVFQLSEE